MTTLREAAQQALEAWDQPHGINYIDFRPYMDALRTALAEPVQEPVAWMDAPERIWLQVCEDDHCEVSFREHDEITWCAERQNPLDVPYVRADFAAPPQRKPLTDEEIRDMWSWSMTAEAERAANTQQHAFARAIEQAHGIKEET